MHDYTGFLSGIYGWVETFMLTTLSVILLILIDKNLARIAKASEDLRDLMATARRVPGGPK